MLTYYLKLRNYIKHYIIFLIIRKQKFIIFFVWLYQFQYVIKYDIKFS